MRGSSVFHFQYAQDVANVYKGISPLSEANAAAKLKAKVDTKVTEEFQGPTGSLIAVPSMSATGVDADGNVTDPLADLKQSISGLQGRAAFVETVAGGWGEGRYTAPQDDWQANRIGPNPPQSVVVLRQQVTGYLLAACGVPPGLVNPGATEVSAREDWRRFLHGSVQPIANMCAEEISRKAGTECTIMFDELFASDIQGRGRAFKSMVEAGLPVADARRLCGLE